MEDVGVQIEVEQPNIRLLNLLLKRAEVNIKTQVQQFR
jgi:hypothetical protein